MSRSDSKSTSADKIASVAEDLEPVRWVVGDGAAVLEVLSVAEENGADDLVADGGGSITDGGGGESCSLTVKALV